MALSAASPFYRGYVSDIDCRWGVISASVDDRTQEERGLQVRKMRKMVKQNHIMGPAGSRHLFLEINHFKIKCSAVNFLLMKQYWTCKAEILAKQSYFVFVLLFFFTTDEL